MSKRTSTPPKRVSTPIPEKKSTKPAGRMSKLIPLGILAAGVMTALAFPPISLWPLAWIGVLPLLLVARKASLRSAVWAGLAFGIGFYGAISIWCRTFGFLPWVALTLIWVPVPVAFTVPASLIYRSRSFWLQLLAIPALWTAVEWLRSLGIYGCTWAMLAATQYQNLPFAQLASWTGAYGLTYVIVLFSAAFAVEKRRWTAVAAVAVLVTILHIGGAICLRHQMPDGPTFDVAVVQGSIDPKIKGMTPQNKVTKMREHLLDKIGTYHSMTVEAAQQHPDMVVWPESVIPTDVEGDPSVRRWVGKVTKATKSYLLAGGPRNARTGRSNVIRQMNGAFMFSPEGNLIGSYYKVRLVPFAEFVPGRKLLSMLGISPFRDVDALAADEHKLLPTAWGKMGVGICFETIFPGVARRETKDGARAIFFLTNDGWYGDTGAPAQHFAHSVLRAIENRRYVVRNACTGISAVIDPYGRVTGELGLWEKDVLYRDVQPLKHLSVYTRFGDWFAYLCTALAAVSLLMGITHVSRNNCRK